MEINNKNKCIYGKKREWTGGKKHSGFFIDSHCSGDGQDKKDSLILRGD